MAFIDLDFRRITIFIIYLLISFIGRGTLSSTQKLYFFFKLHFNLFYLMFNRLSRITDDWIRPSTRRSDMKRVFFFFTSDSNSNYFYYVFFFFWLLSAHHPITNFNLTRCCCTRGVPGFVAITLFCVSGGNYDNFRREIIERNTATDGEAKKPCQINRRVNLWRVHE